MDFIHELQLWKGKTICQEFFEINVYLQSLNMQHVISIRTSRENRDRERSYLLNITFCMSLVNTNCWVNSMYSI